MTSQLTHGPGSARWSPRRPSPSSPRERGHGAPRAAGPQGPEPRRADTRPTPALAARLPRTGLREFLLLVVLYLAYTGSRLASPAPEGAALRNGHRVIDFERALHIAPEHTLNDLLYDAPRWLAVASSYFYETMHYAMTVATLIMLYRAGPAVYRRARNWLVTMTFPALLSFWLFPVAPPRVVSGAVAHDIVAESHQYGWWGSGGGTAPSGLSSFVNENAAMPSLHVGWAIWVGWNLSHHARNPLVRAFGYVYPFITIFVVLSTGNHYLVDVLAGALLAVVAKIVVDRVAPRLRERRATASTASTPAAMSLTPADTDSRRQWHAPAAAYARRTHRVTRGDRRAVPVRRSARSRARTVHPRAVHPRTVHPRTGRTPTGRTPTDR